MYQAVVINEPLDVEQELAQLGLTLAIAQKVARAASAGKASALDIDVAFTPGMFSHIFGNRHLRLELLPRGWRKGLFNNVESTINDELGIQLIFQNVDVACDPNPESSPKAISGKGGGSRRLVQAGYQSQLWDNPVTPETDFAIKNSKLGVTPLVWMLCVSDDGHRLRAEISQPNIFEGNQLESFRKRIFVLDEESGTEPDITITPSLDDDGDMGFDFDVKVARR